MRRKSFRSHVFRTNYVQFNTEKCRACWKCIEHCPQNVIGRIEFFWHKHVRINNPEECTGCLKCVYSCEFGVVRRLVPDGIGS